MNAVFSGRKVNIFLNAKFQIKKIFHLFPGKNSKKDFKSNVWIIKIRF